MDNETEDFAHAAGILATNLEKQATTCNDEVGQSILVAASRMARAVRDTIYDITQEEEDGE